MIFASTWVLRCFFLKKFTHAVKIKHAKDIVLACSDNKLENETRDRLKESGNTNLIHKEAKCNLFTDENTFQIRALIALMMGSDQCIGGVKGAGVANAHDVASKLKKLNQPIKDSLMKHVSQKLDTDSSTVEAYVQAIFYEPAIDGVSNSLNSEKHECLLDNPIQIHQCAKELVHPNDKTCSTIDEKTSLFLCESYEHILPHACIEFEKRT